MAVPAPTLLDVLLGERRISVELRFDRFSTLRIAIGRTGAVSVRAPLGSGREYVLACLERKSAWLLRHLDRIETRRQQCPPPRYVQGEIHSYLGRGCPLDICQGPRNEARLGPDGFEITTRGEPTPDAARRLLDLWYRRQAGPVFEHLLKSLLPRFDALGVPRPSRLKVRAMTSRWGSCSATGSITLNLHLLKAPQECVEYVIAHELCHLRHRGHGKRFYGLLAMALPDWRDRRRRLRESAIL